MDFTMHLLQRKVEEQYNTLEIRLYNIMVGLQGLERLRLGSVPLHSKVCTPPSTNIRFLPLIGKHVLTHRFREYTACMTNLLYKIRLTRIAIQLGIMSLVGGLAVFICLLRCSFKPLQRDEFPFHVTENEQEYEKDTTHYEEKYEEEKNYYEDK